MKNDFFIPTYKRIAIDLAAATGAYLIDKNNIRYLDLFAGLGVNALGYAHPKILKAVTEQISNFGHLSNYFITDVQNNLAVKLLSISNMDKLFFTNSGTETTEAALKLVRKKFGPDKIIFSLTNSFHGRTYGALSLTARTNYRKGFEPFLTNIGTIEFNNTEDLKKQINQNTAAIFIEFIQGEAGINEVSNNFVSELNRLKEKFNFLVVADEIQSGIGRTGKAFAYNYYDILPDIILVAKAIGGGLPLGAMLVNKNLSNVFFQGDHGTTFGGNPVSCAAGLIVLEEIFENGLLEKVSELGSYLKDQLKIIQNKYIQIIKDVRGKGFMIGIELRSPCKTIVDEMLKRKILINCTNSNVIRLLPPLIIDKEQINYFLENFEDVISKLDKV
jgi:predicted acetylornithine/succinylornithine family transaminase